MGMGGPPPGAETMVGTGAPIMKGAIGDGGIAYGTRGPPPGGTIIGTGGPPPAAATRIGTGGGIIMPGIIIPGIIIGDIIGDIMGAKGLGMSSP